MGHRWYQNNPNGTSLLPEPPIGAGKQPKIRFCVILPANTAGRMTQKRILTALGAVEHG